MADILESELAKAVQVKDHKSLHRYTLLIVQNAASKQTVNLEIDEIKSDLRELITEFREFRISTDKRFNEQMGYFDKRFEDQKEHSNQRFEEQKADSERRFFEQKEYFDKHFGKLKKYSDQ